MKTIFLVIPNFVYSSDLLRTKFIETLAERVCVVVLLPMAADEYPKHPNILYIRWSLQFPEFWTFWGKTIRVPLIRMFDHEPLIQRNYQLSFSHWKRKLLRRIAFLFPKYFWNPRFITKLETRFLPRSEAFEKLITEHHPSLVVTATPGFTEIDAEAIVLARRAGLPTASIDFSWDNLTSNCKHLRSPDYLVCWTERMKNQAVTIHGFKPDHVQVSGIMRFDYYFSEQPGELDREAFLKSKGLDPNQKTILVTTVTKGNYKDEPEIIRRFLRERAEGTFGGMVNIFIRPHPKEDNLPDYDEFIKEPYVCVDRPGHRVGPNAVSGKVELTAEDLLNLKSTLRYADVVVNYASTITLEAAIFDKPIVNIGFPAYYMNAYSFTHYKPVVESGGVKIAKSEDELVASVKNYLADSSTEHEGRARIVKEFIGFTDGKSYNRAAQAVTAMLSKDSETGKT